MQTPAPAAADLEQPLVRVELQLAALAQALSASDVIALERAATELHRALAAAVDHFRIAAREGRVPLVLRNRLAVASAQVAAQRETLARATAALDRAIDVLIPSSSTTYGVAGISSRPLNSGALLA